MGKILAILIPIIFLAFPDTVEVVCTKAAEILMSILNPLFEFIGNIAQG